MQFPAMALPEGLVYSTGWPSPALKKLILCKINNDGSQTGFWSLLNNHIDKLVERYACLRAFRTDLFYQIIPLSISCGITSSSNGISES
jgi:hypothetical protein